MSAAQQTHAHKDKVIHTEIQWDNKSCWPRSWHAALSLLYLDHIFMYFYFLGSPTGDSQNGASGVNFTEHDFLSDRGCSQPIFHGCSKQESSERGSGDRCSLEDRDWQKEKNNNRQWCAFIFGWDAAELFLFPRFFANQHIFPLIAYFGIPNASSPAVYCYYSVIITVSATVVSRYMLTRVSVVSV